MSKAKLESAPKSELEITRDALKQLEKKGLKNKDSALKVLREIGIVDKHGKITKEYRKSPVYNA